MGKAWLRSLLAGGGLLVALAGGCLRPNPLYHPADGAGNGVDGTDGTAGADGGGGEGGDGAADTSGTGDGPADPAPADGPPDAADKADKAPEPASEMAEAVPDAPGEADAADAPSDAPTCPTDGTLASPIPLRPWNGEPTGSALLSSGRRPTFRFAAVPGASGYDVEVDDSCATPGFAICAFASPEATASSLATTSFKPAADLPVATTPPLGRRYYWRVRARGADGCSAWSPVRYVDVGRVAGDVDGDGFTDALVGAPGNNVAGSDSGRAYVFLGGAPLNGMPDVLIAGEAPLDRFGATVASAGDVNADGFSDIIVGAPGSGAGGTAGGRAYLFFGGAPPDSTADAIFTGSAGDGLGTAAAGAGDVDGDGFADLVVGAPGSDEGGVDAGQARLFRGGMSVAGTPDLVAGGAVAGALLGSAVAGAGDLDGDGFADFVLGAPLDGAIGRAYVFLGGAVPDGIADVVLTGAASGDRFGSSVAGAGDANGDGRADLLVGAPRNDATATDAGRAYLFLGGKTLDTTVDVVFDGKGTGSTFGAAVAGAGDVNGDGFADLAVGAPRYDDTSSSPEAGRVSVYLGGPTVNAMADVTMTGSFDGYELGTAVALPGDLDGDGFADVLAGAPGAGSGGRAFVYLGGVVPNGFYDTILTAESAGDEFGAAVAIRLPPRAGPLPRVSEESPALRALRTARWWARGAP